MALREEAINKEEQNMDKILGNLIGSGFRDLLMEERPMPVIRTQLAAWWNELSEDQKEMYKERLRFKLDRIRQAAEAFTQELQSASGR